MVLLKGGSLSLTFFFILCLTIFNIVNFINYNSAKDEKTLAFIKLTQKQTISFSIPFYNGIELKPSLQKIDYLKAVYE